MMFRGLSLLFLSSLIVSHALASSAGFIGYNWELLKSESDSVATIEIGNESGIFFTFPVKSFRLIMQPCDSLRPEDDWFCPEPVYSRNWRIGEWIETGIQTSFTIYFSPGPSLDPEFIFIDKSGRKLGSIPALKLNIHADLIIHSSGHTNNMFDKKRMFAFQKDTILELKQPFYHVGLTGKLLKNIKLHKDEHCVQITQSISEGEEVEIMLALPAGKDESYESIYLLRTKSGIMGYIRIDSEDTFGALMKGFFYAGD